MWAEFMLVLDPAPRVFLQVLRFSSLSKNRHAAYSSWLLAVLQGHAWTVQRLPAAPIYASVRPCRAASLLYFARAISETVIIIIIIIIIILKDYASFFAHDNHNAAGKESLPYIL